jgi:Dual specificity phosphatase, catalytic domain
LCLFLEAHSYFSSGEHTCEFADGIHALAPSMASAVTEIIENLFVGGLADALAGFDGLIICVLADRPADEPANTIWMPFLAEGAASLDKTAQAIDNALSDGRRVLVHCGAGSERAPLTVAWFLHRRRAMSLDAAYALLKRKRPIVQDRSFWLRRYLGQ